MQRTMRGSKALVLDLDFELEVEARRESSHLGRSSTRDSVASVPLDSQESTKTGSLCFSQMTTTDTLPSSFNTAESLPTFDGSDLDTLFLSSIAGSLDSLPDLADGPDYIEDVEHWGIDAMFRNGFEVDSFLDDDDDEDDATLFQEEGEEAEEHVFSNSSDSSDSSDSSKSSKSSKSTSIKAQGEVVLGSPFPSSSSSQLEAGCFTALRHVVRLSDQKDLVAKTLSTSSKQLPLAQRQRLVDEFRLLSSFRHDNVAGATLLLETAYDMWLLLDCDLAKTVLSHVKCFGAMEESRAIELFSQTLQGLNYIHHRGVVHSAISPSSLLFDKTSNTLKLTNFQSARRVAPLSASIQAGLSIGVGPANRISSNSSSSNASSSAGSNSNSNSNSSTLQQPQLQKQPKPHASAAESRPSAYDAPEVLFRNCWNEHADIWAAGLALYFKLFSSLPFDVRQRQVMASLQEGRLPELLHFSKLTKATGELLEACLRVCAESRPSAETLLCYPCWPPDL